MTRLTHSIGRAAFAASLLAAVVCGGCKSVALNAPRARVPILVGPVGCIGCAPAPVPEQTTVNETANRWSLLGFRAMGTAGGARFSQLDGKAEAAVPDPCRGQVRLSRIRASSTGSIGHFSVSVHVEGGPEFVPAGTCGPWGLP